MSWPRALVVSALVLTGCSRCTAGRSVDAGVVPSRAWLEGRPETDGATPTRGGTLTVRLAVEPQGFTRIHDRFAEGTMVRATTGTVYETLGRIDPDAPAGPLRPWLATAWTLEGTALTISLRPGVVFHDGAPFTSGDVKAVVERIVDQELPTAAIRASLGPIASVETPTPETAVIRFREPPSAFSVRALLGAVPMMPAAKLEGPFDELAIHRAPVGTGPFRLREFVPGERLVLERFENHREPALLDALVFRVVKDDLVATQLFEKGELDVLTRIPPATWRAMESWPWALTGARRFRVDENAYAFIGWNQRRPVFSDVRVRRALAMLYPAEVIARAVELGLETRTTCPFLVGSTSCDPTVRPLPFDPPAAMALLEEAGWTDADGDGVRERDGQRLTFSFLMVSSSQRQAKVLPLYQEQLARAGVAMTLEPVDAAQSVQRMRTHDFDAAAMSWSSPDPVIDPYDVFHSSQADGGKNYVNLASPEIDALLEALRRAPDDAARLALERRLHRALFDEQVYLFLTARPALEAQRRRVHGLVPTVAGSDFAKAWVER